MYKTEVGVPFCQSVESRAFQKIERAYDIALDKRRWTVDRSIDVGFGSEVQDQLRRKIPNNPVQRLTVAEIQLSELMIGETCHGVQTGYHCGISEFVQGEDLVFRVAGQQPYDSRSNETCAPCYHHSHEALLIKMLIKRTIAAETLSGQFYRSADVGVLTASGHGQSQRGQRNR